MKQVHLVTETKKPPPSIHVAVLNPEQVSYYWPVIERELKKVPHIWDKWWTLEALYARCLEGAARVWTVSENEIISVVVFSQLAKYPAGLVFQVFLGFGVGMVKLIPHLYASMEWYAEELGCKRFEVHGRPGWQRLLKKFGGDFTSIIVSKEVTTKVKH